MKKYVKIKFNSAAKTVALGASAAITVHAGCVIFPIMAGLAGAGLSAASMTTIMIIAGPVFAIGAIYGINKVRNHKTSIRAAFAAAALAFGVSGGIQVYNQNAAPDTQESQSQSFDMEAFLKNRPMCSAVN